MINIERSEKDLVMARRAVQKMGGPAKAARLIQHVTGRSITKVSVYNWMQRGIPPVWADDIYNICGVPPWLSNPGVFPKRLEKLNYRPVKRLAQRAQRFINNGFMEG